MMTNIAGLPTEFLAEAMHHFPNLMDTAAAMRHPTRLDNHGRIICADMSCPRDRGEIVVMETKFEPFDMTSLVRRVAAHRAENA